MNVLFILFLTFYTIIGAFIPQPIFASSQPITITGVVPGCGNEIIESGEDCDGANLNNQTCASHGFFGGILTCNPDCTFNTSQCAAAPPPPPPTGGGGGGFFQIAPTLAPKPTPAPKPTFSMGNFNEDGKVDLVDISIFLYWMGQPGEDALRYDLNGDGRLDIRDISIMLYHWTG